MKHFWKRAPNLVLFCILLPILFSSSPSNADPDHLGCSFLGRSCSWENSKKWTWVEPAYNTLRLDHPSPIPYSSSFFLQANFSASNQSYYMTSAEFKVPGNVACFSFDYYFMIDSNQKNSLSLSLVDLQHTNTQIIWTASPGFLEDKWSKANVQIEHTGTYKLNLTATGQQGFIAVSNFLYQTNECPTRVCDFESGNCGWTSKGTPSGYNFSVIKAADTTDKLKQDHTSRSPYGHVAYLNANTDQATLNRPIARLKSVPMAALQSQCFTFYFMRSGMGVDLRLYQYHINTKRLYLIWKSNRTHLTDEWIRVQNDLHITDQVNLVLEATKTDSTHSTISLDDIGLTPFACPQPISCTFGESFCGWKEETTRNNLFWTIGRGRVRDPSKLVDNQTVIGIYDLLYCDFTAMKQGSGSMELLSEMVEAPIQGACVSLTYRVLSFSIKTDAFQLVQIDINGKRTVVWNLNVTNPYKWTTAEIFIPNQNSLPYRLSLFVKSSNPSTYLAVSSLAYSSTDLSRCGRGSTTLPTTTLPPSTISPSKNISCTFEQNNLCNWRSPDNSFQVGTPIQSKITTSNAHLPPHDHTKDSTYGHVAFTAGPLIYIAKHGTLEADNPFPGAQICFQFYYYFYSSAASNFTLSMSNNSQTDSLSIYRAYASNEIKWKRVALTLTANTNQFVFKSNIRHGVLALDDINVKLGACANDDDEKHCDFEQDTTCIFEPVFNPNAIWQVFGASSFGIPDHTTHTRDGHYYGMDFKSPNASGIKSKFLIKSQQIEGTKFRCLRFSYLLANVLPSTKLFYVIERGVPMFGTTQLAKWQTAGSTGGMWFNHRASFPHSTNLRISIGIESMGEVEGKVFVDDIFLDVAKCDNPHNCDFENGDVCSLETVLRSENTLQNAIVIDLLKIPIFNPITTKYLTNYVGQTWRVFSPEQYEHSPYITYDNTQERVWGKYLLLSGFAQYDRAVMITERYSLEEYAAQLCFSFALYKESNASVLEIYQGESFNDSFAVKIWELKRKSKSWEMFEIQATPQKNNSVDMFFYIVGTLQNGSTYIALDDIAIKPKCSNPSNTIPTTSNPSNALTTVSAPTPDPNLYFVCSPEGKITIPIAKTCDWIKDCPNGEDEKWCGDCEFANHNLCRYTIHYDFGNIAFKFRDSVRVGPANGPNDNALFLVASGTIGNSKFISPIIHQSYRSCEFLFYYFYSSNEVTNNHSNSDLTVSIELPDLNRRTLIWQSSFESIEQSRWTPVNLKLDRIRHSFRIVFSASNSFQTPKKYHAIDHMSMRRCQPERSTSSSCSNGFRCDNSVCTGLNSLCDFEDDCGDGSDERNCDLNFMTSFEFGLGLWGANIYTGWFVTASNRFSSLRSGPTYDHTTGFLSGSYLYAGVSYNGSNRTVIAEIDGPPFTPNEECIFSYHVFKNSRQSTLLLVLQDVKTGKKYELSEMGGSSVIWETHRLVMRGYPPGVYRVLITASLNSTSGAFVDPYIAIDDISFSRQCKVSPPNNISAISTPPPDSCTTISCLNSNKTKVCLRASQFCDFVADCADGNDEKNCGDCKFYQDTCGWNVVEGQSSWSRVNVALHSPGPLPKKDADQESLGGYLTVVTRNPSSKVTDALLRSPQINSQTPATCQIQFSFASTKGATLRVNLLSPNKSPVNLYNIETATQWRSYRAEIGRQVSGFQIQILGSSTHLYDLYEDIALDNIKLIDCNPYVAPPTASPGASVNCDFETDLCEWRIIGVTQRSNWFRTNKPENEPGNDHTSLKKPLPQKYGTWLTTQAKFGIETDYLATTIPLKSSKTYCLSFWYYFMSIELDSYMALFASKSGKASPTPFTDLDYQQLWTTNIPKSRNWNQQYVEISPQAADFYLIFIANVSTETIIGLDDIELGDGNCSAVLSSSEFCDFEVNTCDWQLQSNGWQRNSIPTKIKDHTTETFSGHYLEDTSGQTVTITKQMSTMPIFSNSKPFFIEPFCLQFYYYMGTDGNKDGSSMLTVKLNNSGTLYDQNITLLDTFNDGLLNQWALYRLTFVSYPAGWIEIQGINAQPSTTKLLVDDIRFSHRFCQTHGSCDFEADMCGWTNDQASSSNGKQILWMRIQPNSRFIKGNLIKFDHTTMNTNGNYLILPLSMSNDARSVLKSPLMHKPENENAIYFSMWYFATTQTSSSNISVNALTVRLVDITKRKTNDVKVNATGTLQWTQFTTIFKTVPTAFVFEIEANNGNNIQSDIGIDDIQVNPCNTIKFPTTTTKLPPTEKVLDCNFDSGQCKWNFDKNAWKVGSFKDQQNNYAPKIDHTYLSTYGKYLMFQQQPLSSSSSSQTVFMINSTQNITFDKDHCVSLWYYEDGEISFGLYIYRILPTSTVLVKRFASAIENRRRWNLLKADILFNPNDNGKNVQVQFLFSIPSKQFLIFALDDINVRPGKCQHAHDYVYTFTSGLEDLELEYIRPIAKSIGQVFSPFSSHNSLAPPVDHTTNSEKGQYFLFMNQNDNNFAPTTYIDTLSMMDLPRETMSSSCIRFAYQISGNVTLKVYVSQVNSDSQRNSNFLWTPKYDKTFWTIMEINKRVTYEHKVVFYMEKQPDNRSFVAIDDLTVLSHQCQDVLNCDFENGRVCSYSPVPNDKVANQFNFGIFQAPPQDANWPGPRYDHTTGNYGGGYLFLTGYRESSTKEIISKVISGPRSVDPTKKHCLTLWTQITSTDLSLRLSLVRFGPFWTENNRTISLTTLSNLTQSEWTRVTLTLDQAKLVDTHEIQLLIEGQIQAQSAGLIAIDDISLNEGQCVVDGLLCENGVRLSWDKICDFVRDCPSGLDEFNCGNCDFESGSPCGWINMTATFDQKWLLTNEKESSNLNAPEFDGSANLKGHFLMMSPPILGQISNAETALNYGTSSMYLKNAYKSCVMQFDYFIRSPTNYSLQVRIGVDQANWAIIYTISQSTQSNLIGGWHSAHAHIGERYSQFMVDIVGHLDSGRTGIIALDNIQFVNCSSPKPLNPNQQCPNSEIMCKKSRFCVNQDAICDYVKDCGDDDTDEQGCYSWVRCDFEYSLAACGIKTDVMRGYQRSNVEWNLRKGRFNQDPFEPTIDSTRRDGYGQYFVLETSKISDNQQKVQITNNAEFYSPMMTSSQQNCRMRFFYFINGEPLNISKSYLDIHVQYSNKLQSELYPIARMSIDVRSDLQQRWNKAVVQFQSATVQPFQFVFRGYLGTNRSRIAVDNISFDQNCVPSSAQPFTTTTAPTNNPNTERATGSSLVTVTNLPTITKPKEKSSGGKVAAEILVPLFIVLVAVGAIFFGYRKYRTSQAKYSDNIVLKMKDIKDDHE